MLGPGLRLRPRGGERTPARPAHPLSGGMGDPPPRRAQRVCAPPLRGRRAEDRPGRDPLPPARDPARRAPVTSASCPSTCSTGSRTVRSGPSSQP